MPGLQGSVLKMAELMESSEKELGGDTQKG